MKWFNGFILLVALLSFSSLQAQTWGEVATLPGEERHHPVTFAIDGFGYLVTGSTNDEDFYRYDPSSDTWEQLPDFPGVGRGFSYGVAYEGKAYMGFGASGGAYHDDLWSYDPATGDWTELTNCPCVARAHPALIAGSGKIWVGLGSGPTGNLDDWWEYDIATDSWEEQPDFPSFNRHHPYYFEINGMPYVGFGHGQDIYRDFYRFDFENDEWITLEAFPDQGRVAGTQFSHGGKGYILSGQGEDHNDLATGEFWQYTPETDTWEELTPHPWGSRWAPGSFVIGDDVYLLCGNKETSGDQNDMWSADLPTPPASTSLVVTNSTIEVSPNPATEQFQLFSNKELPQGTQVSLMDLQGKVLMQMDFENGKLYDISDLAVGVYMVKVFDANDSQSIKLVKH